MKRIYVIWGGVLGWDGIITSAGITVLENELKQFGPVKSYLQQSSYRCADDIYKECAADDLVTLIGYSGGGVMATRICNDPLERKKQTINLLVNMDGSPAKNMQSVANNVKSILNIYNPSPFFFGGGRVHALYGQPSLDYRFNIGHLSFQSDESVRKIIVSAVAEL